MKNRPRVGRPGRDRVEERDLAPGKSDPARFRSIDDNLAIAAFAPPFRAALAGLADHSERCAQLLSTAPGLAFAIATGFGTAVARQRALRLVEAGAKLNQVVASLGLPHFMARLPAAAFERRLTQVPRDPGFLQPLCHQPPQTNRTARLWLRHVLRAERLAGPAYALWLARQDRLLANPALGEEVDLDPLALVAWASQDAGRPLHRWLDEPWSSRMTLTKMLAQVALVCERLRVESTLGGPGLASTWLEAAEAGGYRFAPVRTLRALRQAAMALDNCAARSHPGRIARDECRLFAVYQGKTIKGLLEVRPRPGEPRIPEVGQLKGYRNAAVGPDMWRATYAYLAGQSFEGLPRQSEAPEVVLREGRYERYLAPFRKARLVQPLFPRVADARFLPRLEAAHAAILRALGEEPSLPSSTEPCRSG